MWRPSVSSAAVEKMKYKSFRSIHTVRKTVKLTDRHIDTEGQTGEESEWYTYKEALTQQVPHYDDISSGERVGHKDTTSNYPLISGSNNTYVHISHLIQCHPIPLYSYTQYLYTVVSIHNRWEIPGILQNSLDVSNNKRGGVVLLKPPFFSKLRKLVVLRSVAQCLVESMSLCIFGYQKPTDQSAGHRVLLVCCRDNVVVVVCNAFCSDFTYLTNHDSSSTDGQTYGGSYGCEDPLEETGEQTGHNKIKTPQKKSNKGPHVSSNAIWCATQSLWCPALSLSVCPNCWMAG